MNVESGMSKNILSARHFFVVNPACFDNRRKMESEISKVHRFFNGLVNSKQCEPPDYAVHISRFPRDAISTIKRFANAVSGAVPLRVYAVGGDSILFDCLNGVVGLPNVELGFIPYGKKNKTYPIFGGNNKDVFSSLKAQISAHSVPMDALYCGSNYALNHCLIGLEAFFRNNIKRICGRCSFLDKYVSSLTQVLGSNSLHLASINNFEIFKQSYRIWMDDEIINGTYAFINITNSSCCAGNKKYAIKEASPTDGWLNVLISSEMTARNFHKLLSKYIKGDYEKHPDLFIYRRVKKIFLISDNPMILSLDGEIFYDKYIAVEIKPEVVRIIDPTQIQQE